MENFRWVTMKYRVDLSVREIAEMLLNEVTQIDNLVKARMNAYYQEKASIDAVVKAKRLALVMFLEAIYMCVCVVGT